MVPGPVDPAPPAGDAGSSSSSGSSSGASRLPEAEGSSSERAPRAPRRTAAAPRIPGYKIDSVIGRGATGVVFRARQVAVDREVALKVLHPELAGRKRTVRRLQREARTTARLAHPHIVSAIDMGEVNGRWWYAMELVDGPSLSLRLRQEGRLSERKALRLFIPLCEALVHMWEHGVVHRDIKPGNILLDRSGGARLADLGLAFASDDPLLTTSDGTLGTPHYISPEQARDPAAADIRSDIWSFGATLFHVICGRPPFAGESTAEVLSGVLYAAIPDAHRLEPELTRGLVLVLRKCLSRSPVRRYQTPAELLDDLERVRERRRPKVRSASLDPVQGRFPAWVTWAGAATTLAVAGLSLWLATARPWKAEPLPDVWEHLVDLRVRLASEPSALAPVLGELESTAYVPAEHGIAWADFRLDVLERLSDRLATLREETSPEVALRLERGEYEGARSALGAELAATLLERTGYDLDRLGDREAAFLTWLQQERSVVEAALAEEVDGFGVQLESYLESVFLPLVDELEGDRDWVRARGELERTPAQLTVLAGISLAGLPQEEAAALLSGVEERLSARREELEGVWTGIDLDLKAWVTQLGADLEGDLRERTLLWGAADKLLDKFAGELYARGIPGAKIPPRMRSEAVAERDRLVARLREIEGAIRAEEAEKGFDVLDAVVGWLDLAESERLHEQREYGALVALWSRYGQRIVDLELGEESSPWQRRLTDLIAVREEEARRLDGLLDRAADAVRAVDGDEAVIRQGHIGMTGKIAAGPDPRRFDFTLQILGTGDVRRLNLRTLDAVGIEGLVGLAPAPAELEDPADRLLSALFRFRCGDVERADAVLLSGPLPDTFLDRLLAEDLRRRIDRSAAGAEARRAKRERSAQEMREGLTVERVEQGDGGSALPIIELLLADYRDTEVVRRDRELLLEWRKYIQDPPPRGSAAEFRWSYDPDEFGWVGGDRVRLGWDLATDPGERWRIGRDWRANGGLELRRRPVKLVDLLDQEPLQLPLRAPLELRAEDLVLTVDLELRDDEPKLLLVELAGFHVAICAPQLIASRDKPSWQVSRRGLEDLIALLDKFEVRESEQATTLLERGGSHRLQVTVNYVRGEVEVRLGRQGEDPLPLVGDRTLSLLRQPRSGVFSVALRSWEQVTITRVSLEGGVGP